MSSVIETLSIEELKIRKIYLLKQLKKIDDLLLKKNEEENNVDQNMKESNEVINKKMIKMKIKIKK
jgi:hypothetical protein